MPVQTRFKADADSVLNTVKNLCSKKGIEWKACNAQAIEEQIDLVAGSFVASVETVRRYAIAVAVIAILNFTAIPYLYAISGPFAAALMLVVLVVMLAVLAALITVGMMFNSVLKGLNDFEDSYKDTLEE